MVKVNFNNTGIDVPTASVPTVSDPSGVLGAKQETPDTSGDQVNISQNPCPSTPEFQYNYDYLETVRAIKVLNSEFNVTREELQEVIKKNPESYNNYTQNVYGSYKSATAEQREALYQTFVASDTFSGIRSSDSSRSSSINDQYKNIFINDLVEFDKDAAGYIYVAGVGNLPYYDNPGEGMTKKEVEEYADERLKGFLSLSQTPSAKNELSNILATGKEPTDEEKQKVYEMLKADIASRMHQMSEEEVHAISSVLGAGFGSVSLIPELEKHIKAEEALTAYQDTVKNFEIENPKSLLQRQYKHAKTALSIAYNPKDPTIHFVLPAGSKNVDETLQGFGNTLYKDIPRLRGNELGFQPNIKESKIIGVRLEELQEKNNFTVV